MSYNTAIISVGVDSVCAAEEIGDICRAHGFTVVKAPVVRAVKEDIEAELIRCADTEMIPLILTLGGTAFAPCDITPEATLAVIEREVRGIPEAMRYESFNTDIR